MCVHILIVAISVVLNESFIFFFFFQAEDGIRDLTVTGVQTCALPILWMPTGSTATWARSWKFTRSCPAASTSCWSGSWPGSELPRVGRERRQGQDLDRKSVV